VCAVQNEIYVLVVSQSSQRGAIQEETEVTNRKTVCVKIEHRTDYTILSIVNKQFCVGVFFSVQY